MKAQSEQEVILKSEMPGDRVTGTKTMYDVSGFEVFWRNFLAGASRSLGGIVFYVIFMVVLLNIFMSVAWPKIQPLIESYTNALSSLNSISSPSNTATPSVDDLQKALQQLQQR